MTKVDIAELIHDSTKLSKAEATQNLESVLEIIKGALEIDGSIKISGFGSFVVRKKKTRTGRNPQTGEPITIKARKVLTFKPSQVLKEKLNT